MKSYFFLLPLLAGAAYIHPGSLGKSLRTALSANAYALERVHNKASGALGAGCSSMYKNRLAITSCASLVAAGLLAQQYAQHHIDARDLASQAERLEAAATELQRKTIDRGPLNERAAKRIAAALSARIQNNGQADLAEVHPDTARSDWDIYSAEEAVENQFQAARTAAEKARAAAQRAARKLAAANQERLRMSPIALSAAVIAGGLYFGTILEIASRFYIEHIRALDFTSSRINWQAMKYMQPYRTVNQKDILKTSAVAAQLFGLWIGLLRVQLRNEAARRTN